MNKKQYHKYKNTINKSNNINKNKLCNNCKMMIVKKYLSFNQWFQISYFVIHDVLISSLRKS